MSAARRVLATDAHRADVTASFEAMQQSGIKSIPVLIFEVGAERLVHHGSGSTQEFKSILEKLDAALPA